MAESWGARLSPAECVFSREISVPPTSWFFLAVPSLGCPRGPYPIFSFMLGLTQRCSGLTHGFVLRGPCGVSGIQLESTTFEANTIPSSFHPDAFYHLFYFCFWVTPDGATWLTRGSCAQDSALIVFRGPQEMSRSNLVSHRQDKRSPCWALSGHILLLSR